MRPFITLGDRTDHGGTVLTASDDDFSDGKPLARVGDVVFCPRRGHGRTVILTGDPGTEINGRAVARDGDVCSCGARLIAAQSGSGGE